jgi:hypothetical protein
VPKLMSEGLLVRFLLDRGAVIPSPALLGKMGSRYAAAIERFAARHAIPVVRFGRGESKEELARPYLEAAAREGRFGCVLIGVAQERARVWRGWRRGGSDGHPHFEFGRQSAVPNHYYFYVYDRQWGPAFWKCCAYAPYPVWLCLNGHEWAKRQAEQAGLTCEALDNGFRSTDDADALASIRARLGARDVWAFFRRWERLLPSPFSSADRARGYRYQLALRQLELSDTTSSSACPAHTATSSPHRADASPSSSPRPTPASSAHRSPNSTPPFPTRSPQPRPSPATGAASNTPSKPASPTPPSPPEKPVLSVNLPPT